MLREIPGQNVQQQGRRWFASPDADLYVWENRQGDIESFEYCYRVRSSEFSLRWHFTRGFEHAQVDAGELSPFKNNTPINIAATGPDWGQVAKHFRLQGIMLEAALYRFILHKLYHTYCDPD